MRIEAIHHSKRKSHASHASETHADAFKPSSPNFTKMLKKLEKMMKSLESLFSDRGGASSPGRSAPPAGHHPAAHPRKDTSHHAGGTTPAKHVHHAAPAQQKSAAPAGPAAGTDHSTSVSQAASQAHPKFMPVLRGDEKQRDAQIHDQASFGQAVDRTAREYGIPPNVFRAQMQVESAAFRVGYKQAMHAEGDLDRAKDNNTSIGIGQISRKFLDGREWSQGGPGNKRMGGQVVTTAEYLSSPTIQLRVAASNLAQRIADGGSLERGLSSYVSGNPDPSNPTAASYIEKIDADMKDPAVEGPGR